MYKTHRANTQKKSVKLGSVPGFLRQQRQRCVDGRWQYDHVKVEGYCFHATDQGHEWWYALVNRDVVLYVAADKATGQARALVNGEVQRMRQICNAVHAKKRFMTPAVRSNA